MSEFELPRNLMRDMEEHDGADSARRAWVGGLPLIIENLTRRWALDLGGLFQPGGTSSWVAPARKRRR